MRKRAGAGPAPPPLQEGGPERPGQDQLTRDIPPLRQPSSRRAAGAGRMAGMSWRTLLLFVVGPVLVGMFILSSVALLVGPCQALRLVGAVREGMTLDEARKALGRREELTMPDLN